MANKDIISKSVLKKLAADIANLLLKLDIDADSVELLETEQQRIEVRRADLVARVRKNHSEEPFILHVEIQNGNDHTMPLRMLRYYTDIQLAWPKEPIHQYLVYIGKPPISINNGFKAVNFNYRYHLLDMHTVDCNLLIEQDTPDALVLAILCDFKEKSAQDVVNFIVKRLHELLQDDERGFREYFEMLETLSDNRELKENFNEAKQMLTQIDIEKLPSFGWGLEKGIEKGAIKERTRLAIQLLPIMDNPAIVKVTGLSLEEVAKLRKQEEGSCS